MWAEPGMDPGNILCKFLLVFERLRSMPADVVRRMLFFESRDFVPCETTSNQGRWKQKQSHASATDAGGMGQEAESTG
jgi:hypothetical protein